MRTPSAHRVSAPLSAAELASLAAHPFYALPGLRLTRRGLACTLPPERDFATHWEAGAALGLALLNAAPRCAPGAVSIAGVVSAVLAVRAQGFPATAYAAGFFRALDMAVERYTRACPPSEDALSVVGLEAAATAHLRHSLRIAA